jgi:DNA-binding beta-propeller fold protein YncE
VLLSPDDKTLFVSNENSDTITVFSVASNGSLSLAAGSPFPEHPGTFLPFGMATSQDESLLYVADFFSIFPSGAGGSISVFSVASNGALTEVAGSPFLTGQLQSLTAFPPKTCLRPEQATQAIINSVNALLSQGVLNGGQDNSLVVKLQHAIDLMSAVKNAAAIGNLNAFISEVNDLLSSGVLSASQAASLISAAKSVIVALS